MNSEYCRQTDFSGAGSKTSQRQRGKLMLTWTTRTMA